MAYAKVHFDKRQNYAHSHTGAAVARIFDENPVVHARVGAEMLLFRPALGTAITAKVRSVGDGFISCLVVGLFQASILSDDAAGGYEYVESADGDGSGGGLGSGLGGGGDGAYWRATAAHARAVAAARAAASGNSLAAVDTPAKAGHKRKRDELEAGSGSGSGSSGGVGFNRLLACNPSTIHVGSTIVFRLTSIEYSPTGLGLHGSFVDQGLKIVRGKGSSTGAGAGAGAGAGSRLDALGHATAARLLETHVNGSMGSSAAKAPAVSIRRPLAAAPVAVEEAEADESEGEGEEAPAKKQKKEKKEMKEKKEKKSKKE
jgi:hypothetical protein